MSFIKEDIYIMHNSTEQVLLNVASKTYPPLLNTSHYLTAQFIILGTSL